MNSNSNKYHIGKFSITDKSSALVITAKVEHNKTFISELFFIEIFPFNKDLGFISIAFDVVELRSFAYQLEEIHNGVIVDIKKYSGGSSNSKSITVSFSTHSESFSIAFKDGDKNILFLLPAHMLYGLSKQLIHLCDTTMDAVYKVQRIAFKKEMQHEK